MDSHAGPVSADTIIGELATRHPRTIAVFERLGLDYCCGGKRPIGQVVAQAGLDWTGVAAQLDEVLRSADASRDTASWAEAPLSDLIAHILDRYHAKLREDLPLLASLGAKVVDAHSARHPETREVLSIFASLRAELDAHMMKEEHILFPFIEQLEAGTGSMHPMLGHIASPIGVMEREHDSAGTALARLRVITAAYTVPEDACPTYRGYYDGLERVERDLHEHIHLENNVLFPRAIEMEARTVRRR